MRPRSAVARASDDGAAPSSLPDRAFVQLLIEVDEVKAYITRAADLAACVASRSCCPMEAVRADLAGLPFVVCSLKPRSATPRRHHS
jgi:hypothetical protein